MKKYIILALFFLLPASAMATPEGGQQSPVVQPLKPAYKVSALNNKNEQTSEAGKVILSQLYKEKPNATFSFVDKMGNWYTMQQESPLSADHSAPKFLVHPVFGAMHGEDGLAVFFRDIDLFNTEVDSRVLADFASYALGPATVYSNEYEYHHHSGVKLFVRPPKLTRTNDKITFRFNTLCAPPGGGYTKLITHTLEVTPDYQVMLKTNSMPIQLIEIKGHQK